MDRISRNEMFDGPSELSQSFSVGLTALSVGNMTNYEDLYDLKNNHFDMARFNDALSAWRRNHTFSEVLRGTVSLLCCPNPERRLTITELNDLLLKHQ